jgi:hypothetical protein
MSGEAPPRPRGPLRPPISWEEIDRRHAPEDGGPAVDVEVLDPAPAAPARRSSSLLTLLGALLIVVAVGLYVLDPYNVPREGSLPGLPVVALVTPFVFLFAERLRRRERSFDLAGMFITSWGVHLTAAYFRFVDPVDASEYHESGRVLAQSFRQLQFIVDTGREVPGTGTIRYLTGLVHVATFSSFFTTFLVFVTVSFIGKYWFYRAFETGFPDGDRRRYALLVLFWPTLVYWPASLGKEALMIASLALASLGAAQVLRHRNRGLVLFFVGVGCATMIRPHVALIVVIALLAAVLVRRTEGDALNRLVAKIGLLLLVIVGGAVLASATADFLGLENLGEASSALDSTLTMTNRGGSSFAAIQATSNPALYPLAFVTVLFRPFPGEAGSSLDGLLASGTALLLLLLTVVSWRRIVESMRRIRRTPYTMYALTSVLVFVFVFSVIGNFGILDRQRTQVLPFYFVLLSAARVRRTVRRPASWQGSPAAAMPAHQVDQVEPA